MVEREPVYAWLSTTYATVAIPICRRLLTHEVRVAFALALLKAGNNMAARMAMIAMTTRSSIKVNACLVLFERLWHITHFLFAEQGRMQAERASSLHRHTC